MINADRMTAEQFVECRNDLPDGGRWHELHEGRPVLMDAPDDAHGNAVLNLSKALAEWFQNREEKKTGYAVHQIGLKVESDPDSVFCPAISVFDSGQQFEQSDNPIATARPSLVIEVASANDRRSEMRTRTLAYAVLGVKTIWIPDPSKKEIQVISKDEHTLALASWQTLEGGTALPGFAIKVENVFAQPEWWK